jgi:hypothetical protein
MLSDIDWSLRFGYDSDVSCGNKCFCMADGSP